MSRPIFDHVIRKPIEYPKKKISGYQNAPGSQHALRQLRIQEPIQIQSAAQQLIGYHFSKLIADVPKIQN